MSFKELNLDPLLQQAIDACGYTQPTEIQTRAIPVVLQGRDIMASAQTGTGKTAAFVLPALQRLITPSTVEGRGPRILVLTPTRELAQQITDAVRDLSKFVRIKSGSVVGGVPYGAQEQLLRKPLDILVATPGRLMDHMSKGRVDFSRLEFLVLDEADRMLDMGFVEDVEMIAESTPATRQTLLFSATLEGQVLRVAQRLLKDPVRIQIASIQQRHDSIEQRVHQADDLSHKQELLGHVLSEREVSQAIVFTATKRGADQLAQHLSERGHRAAPLHGDMKQGQRNRTVERLRRGNVRVLVATDVAARGLDIKGISHVVNFDLPNSPEDYVHRIGRTGRGGASGIAMSLVGPQEWGNLSRIERMLGLRFERSIIPGLEPKRAEPRPGRFQEGRNGRPGGGRPGGGRPNSGRPSSNNGPRRFDRSKQPATSRSAQYQPSEGRGGPARHTPHRATEARQAPARQTSYHQADSHGARDASVEYAPKPRKSNPNISYKTGRKGPRPAFRG